MSNDLGHSIDTMLATGMAIIQNVLTTVLSKCGEVDGLDRDDVQNLKDVMSMLHDLKKREVSVLENIQDEDLQKYVK